MKKENKTRLDPVKKFPGGFFTFLLGLFLLVLTIQNFSDTKDQRVSFNYQAEHLVNLDLIVPEESRKVALKDNLVSFSGKFRDSLSDESIARFKYLGILEKNHDLKNSKGVVLENLNLLQKQVQSSADWFLHLSGIPIPAGGYWVINSVQDTSDRENSVVVKQLSEKSIVSLAELKKQMPIGASNVGTFQRDLENLVKGFLSPALGIGKEGIKATLRNHLSSIELATAKPIAAQMTVYKDAIVDLDQIVSDLNQENARLAALRSVRNYTADLNQFNLISQDLEKNRLQLDQAREAVSDVIWFCNDQELSTRGLEKVDPEKFRQWYAQSKIEMANFSQNKGSFFHAPDQRVNLVLEKTFKSEEAAPNYGSYIFASLPIVTLVLFLYFVLSRQMKGVGSGAMSFGKSPAKLLSKEKNKVTFKDVAGCDEAKEELQEIIEFLKDPAKFTILGARIPKGLLLIGAPGTGKTLIAKAIAGEADTPFFSISGSDFVEMFVGVGASRIRDMFAEAKKQAPCIIFMDEIDAVGRHRGAGMGGGHDEREQTLNQLLVEMDGFESNEGIILIAATNRPDVLDKALMRPGRFDRRVTVDLPDIKGRLEILKVHAKKVKIDPSVDLQVIARGTPGFSGADLANLINEAALLAARRGLKAVTPREALDASDKVKYGLERRSLDINENEKLTTAFHEAGHAIVGLVVKNGDPVHKVTIIPRGSSLGATHFMPTKNRLSYWKKELLDQLAVVMGGRVAEELFVFDVSSGAQMDITQATRLARAMVCEWGMNEKLGIVALDERKESYLGMNNMGEKMYSEETARLIDEEVRKIIDEAHQRATQIITENKDKVQLMTDMLMEFETLDSVDIQHIIKGTWDINEKKERLKEADLLQVRPASPPPPPKEAQGEPAEESSSEVPPNPPLPM